MLRKFKCFRDRLKKNLCFFLPFSICNIIHTSLSFLKPTIEKQHLNLSGWSIMRVFLKRKYFKNEICLAKLSGKNSYILFAKKLLSDFFCLLSSALEIFSFYFSLQRIFTRLHKTLIMVKYTEKWFQTWARVGGMERHRISFIPLIFSSEQLWKSHHFRTFFELN